MWIIFTQQDEAFNPVGSGESSDESEIESISPVKSELNGALNFKKKKNREETGKDPDAAKCVKSFAKSLFKVATSGKGKFEDSLFKFSKEICTSASKGRKRVREFLSKSLGSVNKLAK